MTHHDDEPAFLDDEGPSNDLPAFISTTNARELYGLREGETVAEAFLFWRMVDDIGEPDGAMEFALEQVAAGIDTVAKDVDEYLRQLEERSRGNVKGEIVPNPEEEAEDKRRRGELDAAFRAVAFE